MQPPAPEGSHTASALLAAPLLQVWAGSSGGPLSTALKGVVTYDNIRLEQEFEAHRVDQGGAQDV